MEWKHPHLYENTLLRGSRSLLSVIGKEYHAAGLHVNFSREKQFSQYNCVFLWVDIRRMLQGKELRCLHMLLTSVAAFIDRYIGFNNTAYWIICS